MAALIAIPALGLAVPALGHTQSFCNFDNSTCCYSVETTWIPIFSDILGWGNLAGEFPGDFTIACVFLNEPPMEQGDRWATLSFDLVPRGTWTGEEGALPDTFEVWSDSGGQILSSSFATGSSVQSYPDVPGQGPHPAWTGSVWDLYYHLDLRFPLTEDSNGFTLTFEASGLDSDAQWAIDSVLVDWTQSLQCAPDIDADEMVGFADLTTLLATWGPCIQSHPADFNRDRVVGFEDLTQMLSIWGECLPPEPY